MPRKSSSGILLKEITTMISARSGNIFANDRDFFLLACLVLERELENKDTSYDELIYWTGLSAGSVKKKVKYLCDKEYLLESVDENDRRRVNFRLAEDTKVMLLEVELRAQKRMFELDEEAAAKAEEEKPN